MLTRPTLGFGLGLRVDHYEAILAERPQVDWFEVLTENYLVPGGRPLHYLMRIRERYPLAMHGVSLSIGSSTPLDREYLRALKALAQRIEPAWISDHLCWTGIAGRNTHDLLPLPYTEEALANVVERVRTVQDYLGRRILLENVGSLFFSSSELANIISGTRLAVFGGLIIFFLIVEPEGLNRLWRNIRSYFRVWPFSY